MADALVSGTSAPHTSVEVRLLSWALLFKAVSDAAKAKKRGRGEIGRHAVLRRLCPNRLGGSSPLVRTRGDPLLGEVLN